MPKILRTELIYIPELAPSLNDFFGVIRNLRLNEKQRKGLVFSLKTVYSDYVKIVDKSINNIDFEVFENCKIKLTFTPFFGTETKKEFNLKKRKTIKKNNRNPFDNVNYSPTIKIIEDRLVEKGFFEDDNYNIIVSHQINPPIINRKYIGHGMFIKIEVIDSVENDEIDLDNFLKIV